MSRAIPIISHNIYLFLGTATAHALPRSVTMLWRAYALDRFVNPTGDLMVFFIMSNVRHTHFMDFSWFAAPLMFYNSIIFYISIYRSIHHSSMNLFYLSVCLILLMCVCVHTYIYIHRSTWMWHNIYRVGCTNPIKYPSCSILCHKTSPFHHVSCSNPVKSPCLLVSPHEVQRFRRVLSGLGDLLPMFLSGNQHFSTALICPTRSAPMPFRLAPLKRRWGITGGGFSRGFTTTTCRRLFAGLMALFSEHFEVFFHIGSGRICIDGLKPPRNPC